MGHARRRPEIRAGAIPHGPDVRTGRPLRQGPGSGAALVPAGRGERQQTRGGGPHPHREVPEVAANPPAAAEAPPADIQPAEIPPAARAPGTPAPGTETSPAPATARTAPQTAAETAAETADKSPTRPGTPAKPSEAAVATPPEPPKPPPLQSDGWKNPFSLTPPPPAPPAVPTAPVEARALPASAAAKSSPPAATPASPGKTATKTGTATREWRVQFAAFRSAEEADRALQTLNRQAGAAIGRIPRIIDVADLGERGIFHRVHARKSGTATTGLRPRSGTSPLSLRSSHGPQPPLHNCNADVINSLRPALLV